MKTLAIIMLCATVANASDRLLCRDNNRLMLIGEPCADVSFAPLAEWEGQGGAATITATRWRWRFDIQGPDYLELIIRQDARNIDAELKRYSYWNTSGGSQELVQWERCRTFAGVAELMADPIFGAVFRMGLDRLDAGRLPDLAAALIVDYGVPSPDTTDDPECIRLIAQLDADDWRARQEAQDRLSDTRFAGPLMRLTCGMSLTPEQQSRIDAILGVYAVAVGPEADAILSAMAWEKGAGF